jgi:signal transduction histidine kinase
MRSLRTALVTLGLAGLVLVVIATAILIGSDHKDANREAILIVGPLIAVASIGTGLYAWWRRPDNRFGALMVAFGFIWTIGALSASDTPEVFVIGLLFSPLAYAVLLHMLVAFPSGRLQTRWERFLVGLAYFDTTLVTALGVLFHQTSADTDFCEGCPSNPILISDQQGFADAMFGLQAALGVFGLTAIAVLLVRRWLRASPAYRTAVAPVLVAGAVTLLLHGLSLLGDVTGVPDASLEDTIDLLGLIGICSIPFAFLAGLLRSRLSRAGAVSELVARLSETGRRQGLRDALADALGDPSLSLAYWLPERELYVDAEGHPVDLPEREGQVCTHVEHEGRPVGVICHDASLENERELVQAVAAAAGLALENERLDAELRARVEELRASRSRIVQAADDERRRLERDLHDGAQQRLVSLALNLRLARSKVDEDPAAAAELIDETAAELGEATDELRELARGLHPAVLSDRGLGPALEALAGRAPVPVALGDPPAERLPAPVESAAYFVVAEALTNVARYADASRAEVSVVRDNGRVEVEVRDDGVGGADPAAGSGLRGLADRVAALDGLLQVESRAGEGTTVRAVIPCG